MKTVNIKIDGINVQISKGTTVLEAARNVGIEIPTLCFLKDINEVASCRVCLVEVGDRLLTSCTLVAEEGMDVKTNTRKVREARKTVVELLLSNHKRECTTCERSENCELQKVAKELNIRDIEYEGEALKSPMDISSKSIVRDSEKCILCGRCVSVCKNVQSVEAINFAGRGFDTKVATAYDRALAESTCINCGQCIMACPVGALKEKENLREVWDAIDNPDKYVVVQTAPAVRVGLGEEFGLQIGSRVTGKMAAALRKIGFDSVFDTDFAADLTIVEEGTELLSRLEKNEKLPLMTSCCPGWIKFVEHNFPNMLENLSTCKSPQEMEGALIKTYFAQKKGIDPAKIVVVSIMPCIAKKFEGQREELANEGMKDVDYVLTTRELAQMIKEAAIDFESLQEEKFDDPLGESTGAGVIFGATGGVAEAVLRTIFEITGAGVILGATGGVADAVLKTIFEITSCEELKNIDFTAVRGAEGVKEAEINLPNGKTINGAIIHGLGNARKVLEAVEKGEKQYDFIEVMACPGGCVTGGGQPIVEAKTREKLDVKQERTKAIYEEDKSLVIRKSHKNPSVIKLYEEFLEKPNSNKAHELLHTHYIKRDMF